MDKESQTSEQILGAISRIIPFSSVDGPGNRFAIFLQGCNFNCHYCHNPETRPLLPNRKPAILQKDKPNFPQDADAHSKTTDSSSFLLSSVPHNSVFLSSVPHWASVDEVINQIRHVQPFIRGITISGGECMLQPEFCLALSKQALSLGLGTLLDSCGSIRFSQHLELMNTIQGIMLDVKAWDAEEHQRLTGQSNAIVLENLSWAAENKLLQEVRTVIVPGKCNVHETVAKTSECLAQKKVLCPYVLIPFRPHGVREPWNNLEPPSQELMDQLRNLALSNGCSHVEIR